MTCEIRFEVTVKIHAWIVDLTSCEGMMGSVIVVIEVVVIEVVSVCMKRSQ